MEQFYLMFEQVIIPSYVIFAVFFVFTAVEVIRGYFLRPLVVFFVAMALLILFTDLRREAEHFRSQVSFNGVITPEIEYIEVTMPVFFENVCNTGVITGGYEHEEDTHRSI